MTSNRDNLYPRRIVDMRSVSILAVLIAIFAMGCGQKVVDIDQTVVRDLIRYEVNSEEPFSGKIIGYYPNGQKIAESEYRAGKKHGKSIEWYKNGQKKFEIEYRDNKRHGQGVWWHSSGQKYAAVERRDDKYHGKVASWYENGQKQMEGEYRDGMAYGEKTIWYENGQKQMEGEYRDGKVISGKCWDKNGNPIPCK